MTTEARFAQFHFLTSYPAALINRDDVGFAKRVPFGGAVRTRISSQCLKRHWRTYEGENSLWEIKDASASVRSRRTFDEFIFRPLVAQGVSELLAHAAGEALMKLMLGRSDKAEAASQKKRKDSAEEQIGPRSEQVTVLGRPELDYLLAQARELCAAVTDPAKMGAEVVKHFDRKQKENLRALKLGAGLDAAMFGRMITGDILARCDAAVHVAHAFTAHSEETESDYFSAVDDLLKSGENEELGSGHIGTVELTSGLFYGYVVIDLPLLLSNLSGDSAMAAQVLERMVHIIATVSPAAKLGSTAAYAHAGMFLVEKGSSQPRTLANAFLRPASARTDLLANAYQALAAHVADLDRAYGRNQRRFLAVSDADRLAPALGDDDRVASISDLARWTSAGIGSAT